MRITSGDVLTVITLILFQCFNSLNAESIEDFSSPWHYECMEGSCVKQEIKAGVSDPQALSVCQLFCSENGALWPKPRKHNSVDNKTVHLDPKKIKIAVSKSDTKVGILLRKNVKKLKENVQSLSPQKSQTNGNAMIIRFLVKDDDISLTLETDETYKLSISQNEDGKIEANIAANTYFGARHALETISQLIVFDDLRNEVQVVKNVDIEDGPEFAYRGILLDTSRNFMDKASILRTILGMSMSKLNTFHWHMTDTHSFPIVSKTWPKMSQYGAYSPQKVYTEADIREIVEFGLLHGVRVLPEFDAPAHVGEGWQWVGDDALVCFNADPWSQYCVEPPCGQLNPTSERVYEILGGLYKDFMDYFKPDMFHMGGDEINTYCWSTIPSIQKWTKAHYKDGNESSDAYSELWKSFLGRSYDILTKANGGKEIPAVIWTSDLTSERNVDYLDPKKYIVQIWSSSGDSSIKRLLDRNIRVILSNYDSLYFDCGFGAWVGEGNNWCSPYKSWQRVYAHSPYDMVEEQGIEKEKRKLVLGSEAALWSEQVDSSSVDMKLWPRAAALAERLWSNPSSGWREAEQRLMKHRERLVQKGINADTLEPEWCRQNQGKCN